MNATRDWSALLPLDPMQIALDPRDRIPHKPSPRPTEAPKMIDDLQIRIIDLREPGGIEALLESMRKRAGFTQRDLADAMGVSVKTVTRVELRHYRRGPTLATMIVWAEACGRSLVLEDVER